MKKILLVFTYALLCLNVSAQEAKDYEKVKFGKIDPEDFNVKATGKDSAASAIELFDIGQMNFAISIKGVWNYTLVRHKRIKILTKEGYDFGNFEIPTYKDYHSEEILNKVQISSYNLVDGKVVQNKAAKDEKFDDKFDKNITNHKYTLSNIQVGTIVEIRYEIQSDFIYSLRDWYFQQSIPVIWSDLTLRLPEYFRYKINIQQLNPVSLISDKMVTETFNGTTRGEGIDRGDSYNFSCNSQERKWVSNNVPAFKDEPYITTNQDYVTKMDFEILSTQFPVNILKNYSSTWGNITKDFAAAEHFGSFIKPNGYSRKFVQTIIKDGDEDFKKASDIFYYVKSNLKWNGNNGEYATENSSKAVFEKKNGNVGDINLSLLNLLLSADLKANPVILSTRSNGRHPGYPLTTKFNYVVVELTVDSSSYLLDATHPDNAINMVSISALNHKGLLVDLDAVNANWIFMDPKDFSTSSIFGNVTFNSDLKLTGNFVNRKTNYEALNARKKFEKFTTEEEYLKNYKSDKNGLNITKYTQTDYKNPENPCFETFDFELEDYMEEAGNLVFFNPLFYERTKENPFKQEERKFPVDFAYPTLENYRLIITIPEGYVIDKLPESIAYKFQDNSASFIYSAIQSGNQVLINSKITLSSSEYNPEEYPDLKELFKQVVAKQSQPVVFKKL